MKRILISLLLIIGTLSAVEIRSAEGVLIPSDLKQTFAEYWSQRAKKHFYNIYKYELPYQQYLYTDEWYEDFFAKAPRIRSIEILKAECKKDICRLYLKLVFKKSGYTYYHDKWIKVNGKWYHRFNDKYLPF